MSSPSAHISGRGQLVARYWLPHCPVPPKPGLLWQSWERGRAGVWPSRVHPAGAGLNDIDEQVVRGVAKSAILDVQISAGAGRNWTVTKRNVLN